MTLPNRLTQPSAKDAHNPGSPSQPTASSEVISSSTRAAKSKQTLTVTAAAAPAVRTFFDPWNSSSTGHQRAENRLSGSTSWRHSRNLKLGNQYKGGVSGGRRLGDTVGAGSEDFGQDGRKENGGWEKGAKGLRTGGQKSLAETWSASKASERLSQEKDTDVEAGRSEETSLLSDEDLDTQRGMSLRMCKAIRPGISLLHKHLPTYAWQASGVCWQHLIMIMILTRP
jgi:hypothetical protein